MRRLCSENSRQKPRAAPAAMRLDSGRLPQLAAGIRVWFRWGPSEVIRMACFSKNREEWSNLEFRDLLPETRRGTRPHEGASIAQIRNFDLPLSCPISANTNIMTKNHNNNNKNELPETIY